MPRALGANFKLLTKQETTPGTAPGGNYVQLPCYSFGVSGERELQTDEPVSTGQGRNPADPYTDAINVTGSATVPVDLAAIGFWLKLLCGSNSNTSGSGPDYTHVFTSGAANLPTNAFEKAFPDVGRYEMLTGVTANSFKVSLAPTGRAQATIDLIGFSAVLGTTSGAGTPTSLALQSFKNAQAGITRDGSLLGAVTGGDLDFSNNLDPVRAIRADNRLEGIDPSTCTCTGRLTMRFQDAVILDQAVAETPSALSIAWTIAANKKLTIDLPHVFFNRAGIQVTGPKGIELPVTFRASTDGNGVMFKATLMNQQSAY